MGCHPGGTGTSGTVTGLTNGISAGCKVAAYSAMGQGPYSYISATPDASITTTSTTASINGWRQIDQGKKFTSASIGSVNRYGGMSGNQLYDWNGTTWVRKNDRAALHWISVGSATNVWGVNAGGSVYKLNAAGGLGQGGRSPGTFAGVSTASDGTTLLLRNDGTLWKRRN